MYFGGTQKTNVLLVLRRLFKIIMQTIKLLYNIYLKLKTFDKSKRRKTTFFDIFAAFS